MLSRTVNRSYILAACQARLSMHLQFVGSAEAVRAAYSTAAESSAEQIDMLSTYAEIDASVILQL